MCKTLSLLAVLLASATLLTFTGTAAFSQSGGASNEQLARVGGTIYVSPTEEPIRDGVVLIQNGKIAAVGSRASIKLPKGPQTLDCSRLTITAGFWNSHVHFFERKHGENDDGHVLDEGDAQS